MPFLRFDFLSLTRNWSGKQVLSWSRDDYLLPRKNDISRLHSKIVRYLLCKIGKRTNKFLHFAPNDTNLDPLEIMLHLAWAFKRLQESKKCVKLEAQDWAWTNHGPGVVSLFPHLTYTIEPTPPPPPLSNFMANYL